MIQPQEVLSYYDHDVLIRVIGYPEHGVFEVYRNDSYVETIAQVRA